jgi:D-alanine-D-alanine ligase
VKDQSSKKKRIGVLMGGMSQERNISLKTGKAIARALTTKGYQVQPIDVTQRIAETLSKQKIDCAFLALHGKFGEDGTIQGMFELMRIPYTGSGVLASALALHKVMAKRIFHYEKIPTPMFDVLHMQMIKKGPPREISLPLPVVVKPAREGSTIGISIVTKEKQWIPALKKAGRYDEEILVEEFIKGREITVGILEGLPLPIVEIAPKSGFYDFHSKYTKGETEYIIPARIPREKYLTAQDLSLRAFRALGCSGVARIDLILDERDNPFVLEVNTMPGMTETSLLPKAANYAGIAFEELAERILLGASLKMESAT